MAQDDLLPVGYGCRNNEEEVTTMAQIKTMHQVFLHELSDMYDGERQLTQAMQEMLDKAENPQVKQGLQRHIQETEQQIKNLDQAFKSLGEQPEKISCKGVSGLVSEFKSTAKDIKEQELLDGVIVAAGMKSEHYEIASYRGLVHKAQLMGHNEAAQFLQQNLQMEERFGQQLEQLGQQLGQQLISQKPELVGHAVPGGQQGMGAQGGMSTHQ